MNDLVERLNEEGLGFGIGPALLCQEAAAEITRLRAALADAQAVGFAAGVEAAKAEGALEAQAKIARLTEALAIAGPIALKDFDSHPFILNAEEQREVEVIRAALQENANG